MAEENANAVNLPVVHVGWDEKGQRVLLDFDNAEFKNWYFVEHLLRMAADTAKRSGEQAAIRQAMEAQRTAQIAQGLKLGR